MSAGYDAEVAELFRDLRAASNLTETDLAARIATPIEVVQALEQGAIYALPPWPETCRVVNAYGTLLNLDTRPLLRRIYAQLEAGVVELKPKAMPDVPVMPQQGGGNFGVSAGNAAPRPQGAPQAPAWPNGGGQQARPQQAPGQAWPGGAPQFGQPNIGGRPQQQAPQARPAQAPWPNGPQAAPRPQAAPQPQARPAPQPQAPAYQPQPQSYPQDPHGFQADAPGGQPQADAVFPGETEEKPPKAKKPALLKWGLGALVASVVLVGLWLALGSSSGPLTSPGMFDSSEPVLDPDDPRSRKADRLPSNF